MKILNITGIFNKQKWNKTSKQIVIKDLNIVRALRPKLIATKIS